MNICTSVLLIIIIIVTVLYIDTGESKVCSNKTSSSKIREWFKTLERKPEQRRRRCLEYGERCKRIGENDRCCLRKKGSCRVVKAVNLLPLCAPPVKNITVENGPTIIIKGVKIYPYDISADPASLSFDWGLFLEDEIMNRPHFVGGAVFESGGKIIISMGEAITFGNEEHEDEGGILDAMLIDVKVCHKFGPFTLGGKNYYCISTEPKNRIFAYSNFSREAVIFKTKPGNLVGIMVKGKISQELAYAIFQRLTNRLSHSRVLSDNKDV